VVTFTAIQVQGIDHLRIDTDADGARGEAGLVIEFQNFSGFTLIVLSRGMRVVVVLVVKSTGTEGEFAVFQETSSTGVLSQYPNSHG
jgi:hypothetical protein